MPDEPIIYDQLEEAYIPGLQSRQVNSARAARKLGRADANMTNPQGGRTVTYNGPVYNNNASRMNNRVQKAYNNAYGRQYNRNAAYTAAVAQDLADIETMRRGGDEAVAAEQNYQTRHTNEAADKTAMALSVLPGTGMFGMVPIMHGIQQQRAAGVTDPLHTAMQVGMATIGMLPAVSWIGGRGAAWADMLGGAGRRVLPYIGTVAAPVSTVTKAAAQRPIEGLLYHAFPGSRPVSGSMTAQFEYIDGFRDFLRHNGQRVSSLRPKTMMAFDSSTDAVGKRLFTGPLAEYNAAIGNHMNTPVSTTVRGINLGNDINRWWRTLPSHMYEPVIKGVPGEPSFRVSFPVDKWLVDQNKAIQELVRMPDSGRAAWGEYLSRTAPTNP